MNQKPLRAGNVVQLMAPAHSEPAGPCMVLVDQRPGDSLVWFSTSTPTSRYIGPAHVARRVALRMIKRTPQRETAPETVK